MQAASGKAEAERAAAARAKAAAAEAKAKGAAWVPPVRRKAGTDDLPAEDKDDDCVADGMGDFIDELADDSD